MKLVKPISLPGSRSQHFIAAGMLLVSLATVYAVLQAVAGTGVPRNATVLGTTVGGMSVEDAIATVQQEFTFSKSRPFHVNVDGATYDFTAAARTVKVDGAATIASITRARWNPYSLVRIMLGASTAPVFAEDSEALSSAVNALASRVDKPAQDASVDVSGSTPVVVPAIDGMAIDVDATVAQIRSAIARGESDVAVTRAPRAAVISTLVAQRAIDKIAVPAVAEPVTVNITMADGTVRTSIIQPDTIKAALSFVPSGSLLTPVLDGAVLRQDLDASIYDVQVFAKRAKFRISGDQISIVPSIDGYGVSASSIARDVATVLDKAGAARVVSPSMGVIPAGFTTEDAQALGITGLVSTYTQDFPAAAYRTQNIGTAARYIQGTILKPGETFSMNDTVHERTVENGYTEGWIIGPDGVFKMEQGGAVSTITTAVFNAAWFGGLKLVEHRAHSIYISRYPAGREATVSWGSFDMKFQNNLQHAILITTKLRRTSISVSFWGTKEWDDIGSVFGPWTNKTPYREIQSDSAECHDQDGMPGFHITVWRTFFREGVEVKREPYSTSYRPSPHVICPGSAPKPKPKPSKTPSASPSATATASASPSATPSVAPTDSPTTSA